MFSTTVIPVSNDGGERYNLVVGEEELPADTRQADAILRVALSDEELVDATYLPDETRNRKQDA